MKCLLIFAASVLVSSLLVDGHPIPDYFRETGQRLADMLKAAGTKLTESLEKAAAQAFKKVVHAGKHLLSQGIQGLASHISKKLEARGISKRNNLISADVSAVTNAVHDVVGTQQGLHYAMRWFTGGLDDVINMVVELKLSPEEITERIDNLIGVHNAMVDICLTKIVTRIANMARTQRRNTFTDFFSEYESSLTDTFNDIKNMAYSTGNAIKHSAIAFTKTANELTEQTFQTKPKPLTGPKQRL